MIRISFYPAEMHDLFSALLSGGFSELVGPKDSALP